MSQINVHNLEGKVVGTVMLPKTLEGKIDKAILWQAVRMYLANRRQGTANTKTRGEVRGGGKKPWAQKHTGRARHGSIRSPIWRKGGIVFGPHPREHRYSLPEQLRRRALVESLKVKIADDAILAVETLEGLAPKTKALHQLLGHIKIVGKVLVVIDQPSALLARISRNLENVRVTPASDLNCYDVLNHPRMVFTSAGLKQLETMLS